MAKKQLSTYKFIPGAIPPAYGQYPNAVAAITANKNYLIKEISGYLAMNANTPSSAPTAYPNAITLLTNNKEFIKEEAAAYIDQQVTKDTKCQRDLGYLIDGAAYDLALGTNYNSVFLGHAESNSLDASSIATNINNTKSDINGLATVVSGGYNNTINTFFDTVINMAVNSGAAPSLSFTNPTSATASQIAAKDQLVANRAFIAAEVNAWVALTYPSSTHDAAKCARDIGYAVDAICYDMLYGGNAATYTQAKFFFYSFASGSPGIDPTHKTQTVQAYGHLKAIISDIVQRVPISKTTTGSNPNLLSQSVSGTGSTPEDGTLAQALVQITADVVDAANQTAANAVLAAITKAYPSVSWAASGIQSAVSEIFAEKDTIATTRAGTFAGYTYTNTVSTKCKRDIGYLISAWIVDLTGGGNADTIRIARTYYRNGVAQLISPVQEAAVYAFVKTLINTYVLPKTSWTALQTSVSQNIAGSAGEAAAVTRFNTLIDIVTSVVSSGLGGLPSLSYNYNATFVGYTYDSAKCERDAGYVIDSFIHDLTYGGNSLTYYVASRYYINGTIQIQTPTVEIATYAFVQNIIIHYVIEGVLFPSYQLVATQTLPSGAAEIAAADAITTLNDIIVNTITSGLSALPRVVAPDGQGDGLLPKTVELLEANKRFIQEEAIAYIQYNIDAGLPPFLYYTYNSEKCRRDISYILEGYINDFQNGGNKQTVFNASKYWENGVAQVDGDRSPEISVHTFIRDLVDNYILSNVSFSSRQTIVTQTINNAIVPEIFAQTRLKELSNTILDVIQYGISYLPATVSNRGAVKIPGFYKLKDFLLITNTSRGTIMYNFADPSLGAEVTYSEFTDSDFPAALYGVDKITTITLDIDTRGMMVTDNIQIFVEGKYQEVRLNSAGTDAMERMKVGIPQSMLDADFEYGLQPTKWQALALMRNYPAIYEIPGSDIPVISVTTDASSSNPGNAGASLITVTTLSSHGLSAGGAITIKALANSVSGFSRAEGSFLIFSAPTATTLTFYAKSKVGTTNGQSLSSSYTQLRKGAYYTNAAIGQPSFNVFSAGSSGTVTTSLITAASRDIIGFAGSPPPVGAPISGTGIATGAQVTAVTGPGGTATSTTLTTTAQIGATSIIVDSTTGISSGLIVDRGDGVAVTVTDVTGNTVSLSSPLTSLVKGTTDSYTNKTASSQTGTGSGAIFTMARNGASYTANITDPGEGYVAGDALTILGTGLGGLTPDNDATVTVDTASPQNTVATLNNASLIGGSDYLDGTNQTTHGGSGTGLTVDVVTDGLGLIVALTVNSPGAGYLVGETVSIGDYSRVTSLSAVNVPGTGYTTGNGIATVNSTGTGTGLTVNIVDNGSGGVSTVSINAAGNGYAAGDVITITGGDGTASFTIATATLPALINIATVDAGGLIQTVSATGTPITAPSVTFVSAFTISELTTAQIASGNTGIAYSAIGTIEVTFTSAHGFIPGDTITAQISSSDTGAQLAAGPFFVEQVPTATTLRYTARAAGTISNTLVGVIFGRPDSFFVHRPFDGGVQLGTASPAHGATAIRMSKKYIRYQSGKGVMYNTGALFAPSYDIKSMSASGTTVGSVITVVTDDTDHGCQVGAQIVISGVTTSGYNGNYTVFDVTDERTFSILASQTLGATTTILGTPCQMSIKNWHGSSVRSGIFDDQNGMFWQYDGIRMSLCRRSSTFQVAGVIAIPSNSNLVSGTSTRFTQQLAQGDRIVIRGMTHIVSQIVSDTSMYVTPDYRGVSDVTGAKICKTIDLVIPQEQWNLDPCNGTGPSGYNLDVTKMQMIGIQHTWYGAGFIDFMLRGPEGNYVWCHRFRNSNVNTEAYMRTGNQPVRYEVINESAKGRLAEVMNSLQTTIPLSTSDAYWFPNSGTVMIDNELIRYTGNSGTALTGCTRAAALTQFTAGSQRNFTGGIANSHAYGAGVVLVSNTITPIISHWGSAFMIDGQFDSDRGYIFNYAATGVSASVDKTTAFLIRLAPSVSNAQIGDLGERELLNRAQLLLNAITVTSDPVSSTDPFTGNTWSSGGTATSGLYYSNVSSGVKNWYQATSTGTFSSTAPVFTSGTGASGTYGVNLTWAGATPNNAGAIVVEGVLNPSNYPTDPTNITWTGLASSAAGGQPSFAQVASGGSVTWSGGASTSTATVQGAATTTVTAKSFALSTSSLTAIAFSAVNQTVSAASFTTTTSATYNSAISSGRSDFLITTLAYDALTTPLAAGDTLATGNGYISGRTISSVTRNFVNLGGILYTRIVMNSNANATSPGVNFPNNTDGAQNIVVTITSSVAARYNTAISAARTDFLITQTQYASTGARTTDVVSATTYLTGGQTISSFTSNYTTIAGTAYARVIMSSAGTITSNAGGGNTVTVTATSADTAAYGAAFRTARSDFLITDAQYAGSGIQAGDVLSVATYITGSQTILSITPGYKTIGATSLTRIVMSGAANGNSTAGTGNDITVTVTATGSGSSYNRTNYLFFDSASWLASGATLGTRVASDQVAFSAGTSVTGISTRTFGATTYYRVTFTQSSNTTIAAAATLKFQFGAAYATPGEQVFSFVANPGETGLLDLTELKELTSTAIGGRGTFPNGPDVLAINVYRVSGSATNANVIIRWGEAQA